MEVEDRVAALGPDVGLPPYPSPVALLAPKRAASDSGSLKRTTLRQYRLWAWPRLQLGVIAHRLHTRARCNFRHAKNGATVRLRRSRTLQGAPVRTSYYIQLSTFLNARLSRLLEQACGWRHRGRGSTSPAIVTTSTRSVPPPEYSTWTPPRSAHRPPLRPSCQWSRRRIFQSQRHLATAPQAKACTEILRHRP
jgi:hypothetical protein